MGHNVFTGARAIFFMNGKKVAYAQGVNGSEEIIFEPVDCLDNIEVQEYAPVGYRVSLTADIFRTVEGTPGATAPAGSTGSLKAAGMFPRNIGTPNQILLQTGMTALIKDRLTGKTLYRYEEVKAASKNFNISARAITGQNVQFNAIRMKEEGE